MNSKRIVLLLILIVNSIAATAQSGVGYQQFTIGAGAGITTAFGNTNTLVNKNAYNFNVSFNYTPFLAFTLEGQTGQLAGGSLADYSQRLYLNNFKAISFHGNLQMGEIINYQNSPVLNSIKNIYFGAGIGLINNSIAEIQPIKPSTDGVVRYYPYYPNSTNITLPFRIGYDVKIFNKYDEPKCHIDFSYSFVSVLGDGMDGYANLSSFKFYAYFAVGFKYNFGPVVLYRKPIDFTHF